MKDTILKIVHVTPALRTAEFVQIKFVFYANQTIIYFPMGVPLITMIEEDF